MVRPRPPGAKVTKTKRKGVYLVLPSFNGFVGDLPLFFVTENRSAFVLPQRLVNEEEMLQWRRYGIFYDKNGEEREKKKQELDSVKKRFMAREKTLRTQRMGRGTFSACL